MDGKRWPARPSAPRELSWPARCRHPRASSNLIASGNLSSARPPHQFPYRAAPVFAAPPCPVVLGADCVVLGPVAVDDVGLPWFHNATAATISMATKKAPMPHAARRPESVDLGAGSVAPMPHVGRRAVSVEVRGGVVGGLSVTRRSCCGSKTNARTQIAVPAPPHQSSQARTHVLEQHHRVQRVGLACRI